MKKMAAWLLGLFAVAAALVWLTPAPTYSAGACATYKTFASGHSVTFTDLNQVQIVLGQTNMTFSCVDDYSSTATQMKTTVNPWQNYAESLATTGQGEIERLRHMWKGLCNFTHWYSYTNNCSFVESGRSLHFHMATITTSHLAIGIAATWNDATVNFRTFDLDFYPVAKNDASHAMRVTFNGIPTFAISHGMVWTHALTITTGHNSSSHSYLHTITPERVAQSRGDTITLADAADASLGAAITGFLIVELGADNNVCTFIVRGAGNAVVEVSDPGTLCSITAATASSVNVYWSAGKSLYQIENLRGASRTLRLLLLGGP